MELKQKLIAENESSTISTLHLGDEFLGFIIEDGYRAIKEYSETRIPGGRYELFKNYKVSHYKKYKDRFGHEFAIGLMGVPNFTDILVHIGNRVRNTAGCLLINDVAYNTFGNDISYRGAYSTQAYKRFYKLVKSAFDKDLRVFITIIR